MDIPSVERLIQLLQGTHIQELTIEEKGKLISIKRSSGVKSMAPPSPVETTALAIPQQPEAHAPAEAWVRAPLVGIFHALRPPVAAGDRVRSGETLSLIESMKLMNDIIAPEDGTIEEVLIEEGQPVEYGQPLFRLRPLEGEEE